MGLCQRRDIYLRRLISLFGKVAFGAYLKSKGNKVNPIFYNGRSFSLVQLPNGELSLFLMREAKYSELCYKAMKTQVWPISG